MLPGDPPEFWVAQTGDPIPGVIRRTIITNKNLDILNSLGKSAFDCLEKEFGSIICRDNDRDLRNQSVHPRSILYLTDYIMFFKCLSG